MEKMKLAVLISGRGSNLQALINACATPNYPAEIAIVISNKHDAEGIQRAREAGLLIKIINHQNFENRQKFDQQMTTLMTGLGVELICLAGFMRILSKDFVRHWWNKVINIHPSLLPAFTGLNVQSRAISSGVMFSGCTVHFLRQGLDEGPIICQAVVPINKEDNAETLAARILEQEHLLYPAAVNWIATGKVRISGERVFISDAIFPNSTIANPKIK